MAEAVGAGPAPGGGASGRGRGSRHGVPRGAAEGARRAVGSLHSFPSPGRAQAAERRPHGPWSIREKLCLASSVMRSGDQNW